MLVVRLLLIIEGSLMLVRYSFIGYMVGTSLFVGFVIGKFLLLFLLFSVKFWFKVMIVYPFLEPGE